MQVSYHCAIIDDQFSTKLLTIILQKSEMSLMPQNKYHAHLEDKTLGCIRETSFTS
jgi:hypothetical protein